MFRLKEQQIHIIIWMMVISGILFFCITGLSKSLQIGVDAVQHGMDDLSDGWIASYETRDMDKLKAYHEKSMDGEQRDIPADQQYNILEVLSLPETLEVRNQGDVVLTHLVPVFQQENMYLIMPLDNASIEVFVDDQMIYSSNMKNRMLPERHLIPLLPEYGNALLTIKISNLNSDDLYIQGFQFGTYNQLWVSVFQSQGVLIGTGLFLMLLGIVMLLFGFVVRNTWRQKKVFFYASVESLLIGAMCIFTTECIPVLFGLSYGIFILRTCSIVLAMVLHLTLIRCFIYKKKVLGLIDITLLLIGVFYISMIVLHLFGLLYLDSMYVAVKFLYVLLFVVFTVVLAISIFQYKRREGLPIFIANCIWLLGVVCQFIPVLIGRELTMQYAYLCVGFILYSLFIAVYGIRGLCYVQEKDGTRVIEKEQVQREILEQVNPNLLFASFQTLQNLIKSGSENSVKMIYYISVYLKNNLQAIESMNEIISFEEELEHIIAYLQLQKTRNPNLDFAIECKVKDFKVPRHSLESLVENAVKHGLAPNGNKGNVAVRTYMRAEGYAVQIIDDGIGFDTKICKNDNCTVAKKLALYENTCGAQTEVLSREGKGTVITIVLPMLENEVLDEIEE